MPPKKAAKKAAKKGLNHHGHKHHERKDLRRAYEHLGRVSAIEKMLPAGTLDQIKALTELAQKSIGQGEHKSAADLLRASEHLAFGSLASTAKATRLSEELEAALHEEYEHLSDKASEHWNKHADDRPAEIEAIYESMSAAATASFAKNAYRRALEFARGAEALAHVRGNQEEPMLEKLEAPKPKKLKK